MSHGREPLQVERHHQVQIARQAVGVVEVKADLPGLVDLTALVPKELGDEALDSCGRVVLVLQRHLGRELHQRR